MVFSSHYNTLNRLHQPMPTRIIVSISYISLRMRKPLSKLPSKYSIHLIYKKREPATTLTSRSRNKIRKANEQNNLIPLLTWLVRPVAIWIRPQAKCSVFARVTCVHIYTNIVVSLWPFILQFVSVIYWIIVSCIPYIYIYALNLLYGLKSHRIFALYALHWNSQHQYLICYYIKA